jgi:glycosyltransferase involved in cell wall biosynthesis
VVWGETAEEVIERIRDARTAFPVEFAGWLPVFTRFGNCGSHPQFAHTHLPPPGYRFTDSRPRDDDAVRRRRRGISVRVARAIYAVGLSIAMFVRTCRECGLGRTLATLAQCLRLFIRLAFRSGRVLPAAKFVHNRNFQSQAMVPADAELLFLTSVPFTYGQKPWVIEVEDSTSLLFPYVVNGRTSEGDVRGLPYFAMVRELLESDACRGIITHMRSTAESLPVLFASETIARKVTYAPLGVRLPKRYQTHDDDDTVNLLFTNSWHQNSDGFFLRGGLDVLEAFWILHARYPQVRLTIRSALPHIDERYHRIIQQCWVRVIDKFVPAQRMEELQRESHIYLLPAARIHIVSVLQAMAYGQAVVVSDGWGMDEYVVNEQTGLVVEGRLGKVSWVDRDSGLLREDYRPMYSPDPAVVEGLVAAVSRLIEERSLRQQLGAAARREVETKYSAERWNAALAAAFDRARGKA